MWYENILYELGRFLKAVYIQSSILKHSIYILRANWIKVPVQISPNLSSTPSKFGCYYTYLHIAFVWEFYLLVTNFCPSSHLTSKFAAPATTTHFIIQLLIILYLLLSCVKQKIIVDIRKLFMCKLKGR